MSEGIIRTSSPWPPRLRLPMKRSTLRLKRSISSSRNIRRSKTDASAGREGECLGADAGGEINRYLHVRFFNGDAGLPHSRRDGDPFGDEISREEALSPRLECLSSDPSGALLALSRYGPFG